LEKKSRFKLTIEASQIITPFAEGGIFSSIGNKPAKLHIDHNGKIAGWDRDSALNAERQIGFQNCIVGPGFIDMHFHGYGDQSNVQYSEIGSFQNPVRILEKITAYGTTACLATVLVPVQSGRFFGVDLDARFKMLRAKLAELVRNTPPYHPSRAKLLGMHFEGPKINPKVSGAIPPNSIWQVSKRDLPRIIGEEEAGNADHGVRMITIAPEMDFSSDFSCIRALSERGIVVALGHSSATLEQTIAAIYAGARHFTHLYNSMGFLFHRNPGIIGAGLVDPRIYNAQELGLSVEIICDFIHVNPAVLSLAINQHHITAGVTDAVANPDMEDGTYEFAGSRVTISEGAVRLLNDGRLAGSVMTMIQTFRNILLLDGDIPDLTKAFEITSTAPAKILGLKKCGKIKKGNNADLVVLDKDYNLMYTIVNGDIAYEASHVKRHDRLSPIILSEKDGIHKPSDKEAVIGMRISAYALWCGYVTDGENVHITMNGKNGNPFHKQGYTGREAILDSAAEAIISAWKDAQNKKLSVTSLGVATSGLVQGSKAVMAMNLPGWKDFDITGELIRRAHKIDSSFPADIHIAVENSANAMALAISRTEHLREDLNLRKEENFIFIKIGQGLGTGVVINGRTISCIEDIASDYYIHLRQAIQNVHEGLPTLLHQTVLINRLIAKGELALMRTCDDEFPELHLESLVSVGGIIHYGREEEKHAGKIFFRKDKINTLIETFETDPYLYENTTFELDLSVKDIIDAFEGKAEEKNHAAAVFKRVGMALGSGIFSLTNTLDTPIRHIVILPQMGIDLSKAFYIIKQTIITTLTSGVRDEKGWDVSFIKGDEKLYVLAGACMCYK